MASCCPGCRASTAKASSLTARIVIVAVGQRIDQLVAEVRPPLEVADTALIAEVRKLRGLGDRLAHAAEAVD